MATIEQDDSCIDIDNKYDDVDFVWKKRKLHQIREETEICDLSKTSHEEVDDDYTSFGHYANEYCLQSSFCEPTPKLNKNKEPEPMTLNAPTSKTHSPSLSNSSAKQTTIVTNKPSVSSKGFENSFKLLKRQIETKSQKLGKHIYHIEDTASDDPTRLEIELGAMQRIQNFVRRLESGDRQVNVPTPLLALLYTFVSKSKSQDFLCDNSVPSEKLIKLMNTGFDVNLKYYVGKDSYGTKCLKIVHQLLREEGTTQNIISYLIIF